MDRFLVGYDGSSLAREALLVAGRLASCSGGHVTAIVVAPGNLLDVPIGIEHRKSPEPAGPATACAAEAERLLRALRVPATVEVRSGDPAETLVTTAAQGGHQLIALGHHGRGALREMLLGSVAKRVLAGAPCPTLVVGQRAPSSLGRILVALDGSPQSEAACDAAIAIARACDARALLLNVVDTTALGTPRHAEVMAHMHVSGEREGVRVLAAAARRCARAGVAPEVFQVRGPASERILRFATERSVDLIAIGRSPRSLLDRLTFGSVGDAILRRHAGAVLVASGDPLAPAPRPRARAGAAAAH